jgi:integrase
LHELISRVSSRPIHEGARSRSTALRTGKLWALRRKDVDQLRGVLHVRQTVKRDVASRDADREHTVFHTASGTAVYPHGVHAARVRSGQGGAAS